MRLSTPITRRAYGCLRLLVVIVAAPVIVLALAVLFYGAYLKDEAYAIWHDEWREGWL